MHTSMQLFRDADNCGNLERSPLVGVLVLVRLRLPPVFPIPVPGVLVPRGAAPAAGRSLPAPFCS